MTRNSNAAAPKRRPAARTGVVTLSLGDEVLAMLRWLPRRYRVERDGLPATSASEVVRDLVRRAYERERRRARER